MDDRRARGRRRSWTPRSGIGSADAYRPGRRVTPRDRALLVAWLLLPLFELYFAAQSFTVPGATQIATEWFCCAVVALSQIRLAPPGWLRSPLWPGLATIGVTLFALGPANAMDRVLVLAGVVAACVGAAKLAERWSPAWSGVLFAALGAIAARWIVLERSALIGPDPAGAVAHAWRQVGRELWPLRSKPSGGSDQPPVVVISIDTMRWDSLARTAAWKRLAARGVAWERAMATSSWTLPSLASLQTGLPPDRHGATASWGGAVQGIDPAVPTLAEELSAAGYRTGAITTNAWLDEGLGFHRGFQDWWQSNETYPHRLVFGGFPPGPVHMAAEPVTDLAIGWVGGAPDRGAYLWVHYVDPHLPYRNAAAGTFAGTCDSSTLHRGTLLSPEMKTELRAGYEHEVDLLDAHLMRLLDAIEARGWLDEGVVVLTADHGEEFWDHGGAEHGHSHHGEVVDVGLALVAPGLEARGHGGGLGHGGGGVASLIDVAPTIRAVAGLDPRGVDLREGVSADRIATAYGNNRGQIDQSARQGSWRVIVEGDPTGPALAYDLAADPAEQHPVALPEDHPLVRAARDVAAPATRGAADVNLEALRALGYVED
jgi:arylsulfatase A-like enzyme